MIYVYLHDHLYQLSCEDEIDQNRNVLFQNNIIKFAKKTKFVKEMIDWYNGKHEQLEDTVPT